ncbi:MAG: fructose-6-phosphate aldolase [Clostridiales bacterium]|jgi:transaldolase|nr:fructose-6-phosphate aldolase [Clostridiales bacterium]
MKFFIDTANVKEIESALSMGLINGVTTNPSIIAREGKEFIATMKEISALIGPENYLFGEVIALKADEMVKEGRELVKLHKNFVVKIPMCAEGLKAVKQLSAAGIPTCVTLCFSVPQALLAANAGAAYVAPFIGRIDDIGWNGTQLISEIKEVFDAHGIATKIVAASTRHPVHIVDIAMLGTHIATVPFKTLLQLIEHPLSKSGLEKFLQDWESVPKK